MNLKINIPEDEELRAYIKDLIRGQVKSILNDDFAATAQQVFQERLQSLIKQDRRFVENSFKEAIRSHIKTTYNINSVDKDWLQPTINEVVKEAVKNIDMEALIKKGIKEAVMRMMQKLEL